MGQIELSLFEYIKKLVVSQDLMVEDIDHIFEVMVSGEANLVQVSALLSLLHQKEESADEIFGFARAMREKSVKIKPKTELPPIDTCGTGGDGLNTFNISTTSMFILAGAGIPVAKHGNRGITSKSGSSDLLTELGIKIDMSSEAVCECIEKNNIGFMFAPLYHPAMKHIMPVRRNLPFRTIFNVLGPLTNPAGATRQVLGVFHPDLVSLMSEALMKLGADRAMVFTGHVPETGSFMDEISIFGETRIAELRDGKIKKYTIHAKELGFTRYRLSDIKGGTPKENAETAQQILSGKYDGALKDIVKLNAAAGLYLYDFVSDIKSGLDYAEDIIQSGKAVKVLDDWKIFQK